MSDFVIIAEPASGMHKEFREKWNIDDYVPIKITFPDGKNYSTDPDWSLIDPDKYYSSMKDGKAMYKTGVCPPEEISEIYERHLKEGKDVLVVALSSGMSASCSMFKKAAMDSMEKYPGRKIRVVDSLRFSTVITMMNVIASEMRAAGKSLDETADWLEANRLRFRQMGPMDDLNFLAKAGRITGMKAFFGTLVGVNSLGDFNNQGISQVLGTVKGKKKAIDATVKYVAQTITDPENQVVFIGHTHRAEEAAQLKELIEAEIHPKEVIVTRVDMSCGANIGPGMVGVYYMGEPGSEGLEKEQAVMNKIIEGQKR
ncbi:MAG: DegV family protein [Parasporobacterium sp.]|nr:DegV family protein [Parasporobacterium sp.]